jgi:hypothetical protein
MFPGAPGNGNGQLKMFKFCVIHSMASCFKQDLIFPEYCATGKAMVRGVKSPKVIPSFCPEEGPDPGCAACPLPVL